MTRKDVVRLLRPGFDELAAAVEFFKPLLAREVL
jgi:hypothetical protein